MKGLKVETWKKEAEDVSSHGAGCRKRAGTLLRTDSGMDVDIPAGKDPTLHSLPAEPVPIRFVWEHSSYTLNISRCVSS